MSGEGFDPRRDVGTFVGCFNGCAVQVILGGAIIFLLIVLGYRVL